MRRVALGEVIKVKSGDGLVAKNMAPDGKFPVYGGNGINGYHDAYMFEEPKVILGRVGVYCGVVHLTKPKAWVTDNALYVREYLQPVETAYLVEALKAANLNQYASQAAQPLISGSRIYPVRIPLPPLAEQKRIAGILDAADALRAKRRESLAQLDNLLKSTFLDLFGDPVTNPIGWKTKKLVKMMRIRRGGSPRPIAKYLGGSINWIKIGDATGTDDDLYITSCAEKITEGGLTKTTLLEPGSFVFANSGVSLGFARILKIQGAIHDGWLAFDEYSPDELNELYFLKALNAITDHFRRTAPSGTQPNLNTGIMKAFRLILPPIDLQRRFAAIVESVERHKVRLRTHLAELDALFASLQSRAFNGEL